MKELIRYQTDRGLDKKSFEINNEVANIFEELLEAHGLDVSKENRPMLKDAVSTFVDTLLDEGIAISGDIPSNFERVDAFVDIIAFATGAILKLGHNPIVAITECGKEINSRVGKIVDGKFEKTLTQEARNNWYKADYTKSDYADKET
jgi:hypothetical protein